MDRGLVAQRHRIEAVDDDGDHHERIAEIDVELQQPCRLAMAGGQRNAGDRQQEADDLRRRSRSVRNSRKLRMKISIGMPACSMLTLIAEV